MSNSNSRERTIYRSLAGKIQLGFYDNETRFPSAKEIASQYQVSYCPAQRALKMLEQGGLIKLCRGKSTAILDKPYRDYLESPVFKQRAHSLLDVIRTLNLILPDLCLYGMIHGDSRHLSVQPGDRKALSIPGRYLYQQFENSFLALGSRTVLSLYYDISSFAESALLDILYSKLGSSKADDLMTDVSAEYDYCVRNSRTLPPVRIRQRLEHLSGIFYGIIESYLLEVPGITAPGQREVFAWARRKGRTRYCDTLAINIVCKINQGVYPVGTLLPSGSALADIYHVSEITMRRTIHLLNQLGVVKTLNGIGTRVISASGPELLYKIRELMMEDHLRGFLETLQLLAVTCEPVIMHSFPYFSQEAVDSIAMAASVPDTKESTTAVLNAVMQAVIRFCPLMTIRDIYRKITLFLSEGNVLRPEVTGPGPVSGWNMISHRIQESCAAKDSALLAGTFRLLSERAFLSTKHALLELGISQAEEVAGETFLISG